MDRSAWRRLQRTCATSSSSGAAAPTRAPRCHSALTCVLLPNSHILIWQVPRLPHGRTLRRGLAGGAQPRPYPPRDSRGQLHDPRDECPLSGRDGWRPVAKLQRPRCRAAAASSSPSDATPPLPTRDAVHPSHQGAARPDVALPRAAAWRVHWRAQGGGGTDVCLTREQNSRSG